MILGIGTDIVEIKRIARWRHRSPNLLRKIFSEQELYDCSTINNGYNLEKLAARFAAKEACFKAFCQALVPYKWNVLSFLTFCKNTTIFYHPNTSIPSIAVNLSILNLPIPLSTANIHLSLAHERDYAIAFVIMSTTNPRKDLS